MKPYAIKSYLIALLCFAAPTTMWLGCHSKYTSNYNYAKENESYLNNVKTSAWNRLNADAHVKAVLSGTDTSAATALQKKLDSIQSLMSSLDGVAFASTIETILASTSTTNSTISSQLGTLVSLFTAMAAGDNPTVVASHVQDSTDADSARNAMTQYASSPTSDNATTMVQAYYSAAASGQSDISSAAPITTALIFSGSAQATSGPDNISTTVTNIANVSGGATVGDTATETQLSGLSLINQVLTSLQTTLSQSSTTSHDDTFNNGLITAFANVVNSAGNGMAQIAAVVALRTEASMITSSTTISTVTDTLTKLVTIFQERTQISSLATAAATASGDADKTKAIAGLVAQLNQLISFINTDAEVTATNTSISTLISTVAAAGGNVTTITNAITSSNTALASSVTSSGSGSTTDDESSYYFVGYSNNSSGVSIPGYWKNGTWTALPSADATKNYVATKTKTIGSDVYILGYQSTLPTIPGYWKNGTWTALPVVSAANNGSPPNGILNVGSDIYITGAPLNSSNIAIAGYWKNNVWTVLTPIDATKNSYAQGIATLAGDIYIAGYCTNSSNVLVAGYWKNGTWNTLPVADTTLKSQTRSIVFSGSDIYLAGADSTTGSFEPVYWKNAVRTVLPTLDANKDCIPYGLTLSSSDIYIGAICTNSSNITIAGYWKNGTWTALPALDATKSASATNVYVKGTSIYAVGGNRNSSNIYSPGYWKNGTWKALTPLDATQNAVVQDMTP